MEVEPNIVIRNMNLKDLDLALTWANKEGWFFSFSDAEPFFNLDPNGFFICEVDRKPVGVIITPKYGTREKYGFIDIFLVKDGERGKGYGTLLLNHAMEYLKDCKSIGLESEFEMKDYWKKHGFNYYHDTLFYVKIAKGKLSQNLINLKEMECLDAIVEYDTSVFGYSRKDFLECLLKREDTFVLGAVKDNMLIGFGVLRRHHKGESYFFGPLSADTPEAAKQLLEGLQSFVPEKRIYTSIFSCNKDVMKMINQEQGWRPTVRENRMYKGSRPNMDTSRIYCPVEEFS